MNCTSPKKLEIEKGESWKMFDDISPRYDLLNRLLSLGQDLKWRRSLIRHLPAGESFHLLDVATGTADVLIELAQNDQRIASARGIDMSENMLNIGRRKVEQKDLSDKVELIQGDANHLPFSDNTFEVATIAFGIRNMADPKKVLSEMSRVLKNGGRVLVLEFSMAQSPALRFLQLFYLRIIVPAFGFLFTGHFRAYSYLNQTIEEFPYGQGFMDLLKECGFEHLSARPLMFGAATIYQGNKTKPLKECPWIC